MTKQIISTIKVLTLAVVLSFGLSYVYAWTAPTATPPSGNVSAPINTSATAQTKAGALTVGTFSSAAATVTSLSAGAGTISTTGFLSGSEIITNKITFTDGSSQVTAVGIPTGAVMYFNLAICPSGWLDANGSAGTPDLRGEFIRGLDNGRGIDSGRTLSSYQADNFKSHTHTYSAGIYNPRGANNWPQIGGSAGSLNSGATGGTETRPRNVALLACIKS